MDTFKREQLTELANAQHEHCVSLYAPMYRAGREVRQNEIRFKNLLDDARQQLSDRGADKDAISAILAPAEKRIGDEDFWQHQSDGLVVLLADGAHHTFRLPVDFEQEVVVGQRFHLAPLTDLVSDDYVWYLLAVSQNDVRLLQATPRTVQELDPEGFPKNLRDALNIDEYVSALQFHSTSGGKGPAGQDAVHHGHGASDMDVKKQDEILQYFHRLSDALADYFGTEQRPLVFAGVEYLFPIFREACDYNHLVAEPVTGNPERLSPEQLHEKGWKVVQPTMDQQQQRDRERYDDKFGSEWVSDDVKTIYRAAEMGQIDALFVRRGAEQWATFGEDGKPQLQDENSAAAEDLINRTVLLTLTTGGRVYHVDTDSMPNDANIAALCRSPIGEYVS